MNRLQKIAIFNIVYVIILLACILLALLFLINKDGTGDAWKQSGSLARICCIILLVLLVLQSWPNKKFPDGKVYFDERDKTIQIKSLHKALWGFFGVFMWMMWLMIPPDLNAIIAVPILLFISTATGIIVYSISVLNEYRLKR